MLKTTKTEFTATDSSGKKLVIICLLYEEPLKTLSGREECIKHLPELITIDSLGSVSHVNAHDGTFVICGDNTEYSCPELTAFIDQWNESA